MRARLAKSLIMVGLLAGLCALSGIRETTTESWVRSAGAAPGPVRILQFYASAGSIRIGQTAMLCYSVENAKSVRIAPLVEGVSPAAKRCLEVVPLHTTHYTILAEGFDGHVAMRSLTLPVESMPTAPPRPVQYASAAFTRRDD